MMECSRFKDYLRLQQIAGTGLGYTDNSGVHQPVVTIGYDFSGNNADNWLNNGNQPLFVRDISKAVVPSFLLQHVSISQPRAYRPGPTPLQTWEREINGRVKNSMFGFAPLWNNEDDGGGLGLAFTGNMIDARETYGAGAYDSSYNNLFSTGGPGFTVSRACDLYLGVNTNRDVILGADLRQWGPDASISAFIPYSASVRPPFDADISYNTLNSDGSVTTTKYFYDLRLGDFDAVWKEVWGQAFYQTSDKRRKTDIRDLDTTLGLSFIRKLKPKKYKRLQDIGRKAAGGGTERSGVKDFAGLLAQDVEESLLELGLSQDVSGEIMGFAGLNFRPARTEAELSEEYKRSRTYKIGDTVFEGWREALKERYAIDYTQFVTPLIQSVKELDTMVQNGVGQKGERGQKGENGDSSVFTGLNSVTGSYAKSDLTSGSSAYLGSVKTYTVSGANIKAGQPVCLKISSTGPITCGPCDANTSAEDIIGIATADTNVGSAVAVMTNGYITARRTTITASSESRVILQKFGVEDRLLQIGSAETIIYKDDGGDDDYSASNRSSDIFDAGVGNNVTLIINSFEFEGGNTRQYDRLAIFASDSTGTLNNNPINVGWMQVMMGGAPEYSSSFGDNQSYNNFAAVNGNVLPTTTARAALLGSGSFPITLNIDKRYVKFYFYSDTSTHRAGWNIGIRRNPQGTDGPVPGSIGQRLYLDTNGYDKVVDVSSSGISIGRIAATDASNNAVYMRSLDFSVYDGSVGERGAQGAQGAQGEKGQKGEVGNLPGGTNSPFMYRKNTISTDCKLSSSCRGSNI